MKTRFIPQVEPSFDKAEIIALSNYINNGGWGAEFTKTEEFENMISEFTKSKYCSVTVNGTVSLILALLALNLKKGDQILVPDITMIASPNSAILLGIKPVLVDIEENTLCMDLEKAGQLITKKTKAVMYVSFNGRSGNMNEVVNFCKINKLLLIEDAAQALGSNWNGKQLGTFGNVGSFSFSTPKIITTGQGGALLTDNVSIYKKIEKIKDFGRISGGIDIHNSLGWNFKFNDFLAVIGIEQMKKLKKRIQRKKEIYQQYYLGLKNIKQVHFVPTDLTATSPWFVDIYIDNPDKLSSYLKNKGIGTRKIYPAIHTQKIYDGKHKNNIFPVAEKVAQRGLWLPSSIKLSINNINYIIKSIRKYYNGQ